MLNEFPVVFAPADSSKFVYDPFLENHRRRLREAANVWLLGDCCRWIMKCTGKTEATHSAGSVLELCNNCKCQLRARKGRWSGKMFKE